MNDKKHGRNCSKDDNAAEDSSSTYHAQFDYTTCKQLKPITIDLNSTEKETYFYQGILPPATVAKAAS